MKNGGPIGVGQCVDRICKTGRPVAQHFWICPQQKLHGVIGNRNIIFRPGEIQDGMIVKIHFIFVDRKFAAVFQLVC